MRNTFSSLGQFYPGQSILHELDPRVKISISLIFMVAAFSISSFVGILVTALLAAAAIVLSKIPVRVAIKGIKGIRFLLLLTVFIHLFFTDGDVMFHIGTATATRQGLTNGVLMAVRLTLVVWTTNLLTLTTPPARLTDGLESLLMPLARLKLPAHEIAMMMSVAMRFIPTMTAEAENLIRAQRSRGASFEAVNPITRARSYIPIVIPLFVGSIRRADELALAMESRCYRGGQGRTRLDPLLMTIKDWASLVLSIVVVAVVVLISRIV